MRSRSALSAPRRPQRSAAAAARSRDARRRWSNRAAVGRAVLRGEQAASSQLSVARARVQADVDGHERHIVPGAPLEHPPEVRQGASEVIEPAGDESRGLTAGESVQGDGQGGCAVPVRSDRGVLAEHGGQRPAPLRARVLDRRGITLQLGSIPAARIADGARPGRRRRARPRGDHGGRGGLQLRRGATRNRRQDRARAAACARARGARSARRMRRTASVDSSATRAAPAASSRTSGRVPIPSEPPVLAAGRLGVAGRPRLRGAAPER